MIIAIDGPAGAGKSTIAKEIAKRLDFTYIDTGAMYRAFTYKVLKNNVHLENMEELTHTLNNTTIDFINNHIYLDGKIVDKEIRENEISQNVSAIAKIKEVRYKLVQLQRNIGQKHNVIMDGRDIGSYVFPNADYKFFITASAEERGRRRFLDLIGNHADITLENVIKQIKKRDQIDSTREVAPLIQAEDAIEIDTTNKSIEEVMQYILKYIGT